MKISILGTGIVGMTIAERLSSLGNEVYMGTRDPGETIKRDPGKGPSFSEWLKSNPSIELKAFKDLPADSSIFINATNGNASMVALKLTGKNMDGKVLIDISNPLDFSNGMPPSLFVCNTDSLSEQIQKEFPEVRVVKSLNTMNCRIMMDPTIVKGEHNVFMSGNDTPAKAEVRELLRSVGWPEESIIDLGDLSTARGTEMLLPLWLRLWGAAGHANFNFHIAGL